MPGKTKITIVLVSKVKMTITLTATTVFRIDP